MIICRCDLAEGCPKKSFHGDEIRGVGLARMSGGGGVSERGVVVAGEGGGTGWRMKREREGRVSSSRQKQIAIVCEEPRQCRA